jgi:hypothetical protein
MCQAGVECCLFCAKYEIFCRNSRVLHCSKHAADHPLLCSPLTQFRHTMALVLNAAAACPIFSRRRVNAHYLQPPSQIGIMPSQRSLEVASLQLLWCNATSRRNGLHRKNFLRLLCCCGPLSTLAFRLTRVMGRHEGHLSFEHRAIACIMKQCFSIVSRQLFEGEGGGLSSAPAHPLPASHQPAVQSVHTLPVADTSLTSGQDDVDASLQFRQSHKQTVAKLLASGMLSSSRICADIARSIGISRDAVVMAVRDGMPLQSAEAAREWLQGRHETLLYDGSHEHSESAVQVSACDATCHGLPAAVGGGSARATHTAADAARRQFRRTAPPVAPASSLYTAIVISDSDDARIVISDSDDARDLQQDGASSSE